MLPAFIKEGETVPNPNALLGDLETNEPEETTLPCLRATNSYKHLLLNFARCICYAKPFDNQVKNKSISKILTPFLEAVLVLVYVNNHDNWKKEVEQEADENYDKNNPPPRLLGRFTQKSRGKYKGWNAAGIKLYNKLVVKIMEQRNHTRLGAAFDEDVKRLFQAKAGDTDYTQEGNEPSIQALNGIANWKDYVEV